jgi:hypothetical protein
LIALALVIITSSSLAEAAPINNESVDNVPIAVQEEVQTDRPQIETPVVIEPVVEPVPAPVAAKVPQPTVHPKGCENYRDLYTRVFGSKADVFLKIANKESSCNPMAVGDKHLTYWQGGIEYGMSCGLLQVRYLPGRPNCSEMQDPTANAQYALNLYNSGGFRHWSVCNKGLVSCY